MDKKIAVIPGDGIGPEVMTQALRVLDRIQEKYNHNFTYTEALIGGAAYDKFQNHFPEETRKIAAESDAILFGSVGGPVSEVHLDKWKDCERNALLGIRKAFEFNCNYRPSKVYSELSHICPLKDEVIGDGIDVLVVRELLGGIYFGEHSRCVEDGIRKAKDVSEYDENQIKSIAHAAFQAAGKRRKKLASVDKANVLDTSRLWREVVREVAKEYPEIEYQDILVDNCAMQIIKNPSSFDVLLCPNLFGDIISDEASVLPGTLGIAPSASLNKDGFGLYEPSGGSAPDIAGKNIANPVSQILSAAMLLKYSFDLKEESEAIEKAVEKAFKQGYRTSDIALESEEKLGTVEFTDKILENL
ncbi:UNVERIFIED_CONTAM: hypothetical protein GTU68_022221 [Idotea baltica]|nr:hypothetical protein [Idotea baltica]